MSLTSDWEFANVLNLPRDIFYIDPAYFRSQGTVDAVVDDLAYTIGVDRQALRVVSAAHCLQKRLPIDLPL